MTGNNDDATRVDCPADGCDYGPYPVTSVAGHFGGKTDSAHSGGYQACLELLNAEHGDIADDTEPADTQDTGRTPPPDPPEPESGCPECGSGRWFDPRAALEANGLDPNEHPGIAGYDRACTDCSDGRNWQLYDNE